MIENRSGEDRSLPCSVFGPSRNAAAKKPSDLSRRGFVAGLTAAGLTALAGLGMPVIAANNAHASYRRLRMTNSKSSEYLDMVYWIDGEYLEEAFTAINHFMRDLRADEMFPMVRANIDNLSATQMLLDSSEPFNLVSGYRTQRTNDALVRNSGGVARKSLHIKGMAADIQMRTRSVDQIASAARQCDAGGVGKYKSSNFVHIDCGRTRSW